MQKPTSEDYRVSIFETYNINASADIDGLSVEEDDHNGNGPEFIFELENNPSFYAECNDSSVAKAWLHNARAVLSVLARLHEAEELILQFSGVNRIEVHAKNEMALYGLAERIKAGRAAQA